MCVYIYSLKESEDGQLLTTKKLKNLIKNKNVSVLDLHQLHLNVTDETGIIFVIVFTAPEKLSAL